MEGDRERDKEKNRRPGELTKRGGGCSSDRGEKDVYWGDEKEELAGS